MATSRPARLGQLIRLLGSDRDGEVVAAVRALNRLLHSSKYDWHDLAHIAETHLMSNAPIENWRKILQKCLDLSSSSRRLTTRDKDFLNSLKYWNKEITSRQRSWLISIAEKLGVIE